MDRQRRRRRRSGGASLAKTAITLWPILLMFFLITGSQTRPIHSLRDNGLLLLRRGEGEVNPVKAKSPTRPDPEMPGLPNLNVLADKDTRTYTWNGSLWSITETVYKPGIFYSRLPQANG